MENFTSYGRFMYNLCMRWTKFIVKHRALYYFLACTWGFLMTFIGALITVVLCACGCRPEHYYWIYYQKAGPEYWGGFEMGLMFVRDKKSSDKHINPHEFGHTFQNCLFGPLMIFLVSIPSAIRYWYREIRERQGKKNETDYDDIWFEKSATDCGNYAVNYFEEKSK